ncbi:DNA ligase D [Tepidamorphus sp. 3E244]|uniref:DNA ligase D n=1 Tax=Tepidamorphus sp. 3E244 TaxID=3385498 RepID=UPI0038FCBD67
MNALREYNEKRDFSVTAEPQGKAGKARNTGLQFLVQKHDATRLHYDLRLELGGVLLSWAVTKGPSADTSEKRLAVRTEDHPLSYGDFEGTIPKGEYGGGTVMLWDTGTWEPNDPPEKALAKGKISFRIYGKRMQGNWALVKLKPRKGEKRENWLLIKEKDEFTIDEPDLLTEENLVSVKTGRTMDEIAKGAKAKKQAGRKRLANPKFVKPQLATLVDAAPEGDDWLHETKFDGYRCLASIGSSGVKLYTRSGLDWSDKFAPLIPAFEELHCKSALIDGEVVAPGWGEMTEFSALQKALKEGTPLRFYAFDLLEIDGKSLKSRPLTARKEALAELIHEESDGAVRHSVHVEGDGADIHAQICKAGGEGIIAKKADAPYRSARTKSWLKVKCTRRQEFVVGGTSKSDKPGRPFSSLLLGQYENGELVYRGRVGSGFSEEDLESLEALFQSLERKTSPFDDLPRSVARDARWVTPKTVVEIDFAEFTHDGAVRHGVFLGVREDRSPETVTPQTKKTVETTKTNGSKNRSGKADVLGIKVSSPDRAVFPNAGVTKKQLAEYYAQIGERMAQVVADRPLSLVRCPEGIGSDCFFQKHAMRGAPDALKSVTLKESDGDEAEYLYVDDARGLVAAVQMGSIEFHVWGSRRDKLEKPDRLVFDLDPDEYLGFKAVKDAAFHIRDELDALELKSTAMLTGGKGIHVIVPLRRTISWDTLKTFSKTFATLMSEAEPKRYIATMSKAKRKGRIFIDWLRNERGSTAIAPYSVRARTGAPVAVPVTWDELSSLRAASKFKTKDALKRLDQSCPYIEALDDLQTIGNRTLELLQKKMS